jgi:iron complex transport system substrate-binding protein
MRLNRLVIAIVLLVAVTTAPAAAAGPTTERIQTETPCGTESSLPVTVTDATGTTITVEQSPDSVVALQPSDARTIYRIGAADRLDGLPYMAATEGLDRGDRANVGTGLNVNHERVIELDPDVVLAANVTSTEDVAQLRRAGLTVYHFAAAESIADVRQNVLLTGALVGECPGATETVAWMDRRLDVVETAVADVDRPLVYYELGGGYTTGDGTFQHEVLTTAGLENVGERAGLSGWGQLSGEVLISQDPDWIVFPDRTDRPDVPDSGTATTAYQNERFVPVDANNVSQPAPQVVYAIEEIVRSVHPDAYQAALDAGTSDDDPTGESSTNDTTATADDTDTASTDSATSPVPGFGSVGAVAALVLGVALLARRR